MIFFTRKIYDKMQAHTFRETPAEREWLKRIKIYDQYRKLISPLLPPAAARLARAGLHDATILSARQTSRSLILVVETTNALSRLSSRHPLKLSFKGVRRPVNTKRLQGAWWVCEEVHLSSHARFALHVLFQKHELEIEADELIIG